MLRPVNTCRRLMDGGLGVRLVSVDGSSLTSSTEREVITYEESERTRRSLERRIKDPHRMPELPYQRSQGTHCNQKALKPTRRAQIYALLSDRQ